jgi:hypothetical protein
MVQAEGPIKASHTMPMWRCSGQLEGLGPNFPRQLWGRVFFPHFSLPFDLFLFPWPGTQGHQKLSFYKNTGLILLFLPLHS